MFGIMDNHGTSGNDDEQQSQIPHELLLPRDVLSRTNWLYRVDALRVHDLREMEISYYLANFYLGYISRLLVMSTSILTYIRNPFMVSIRSQLHQVYDNVSAMLHLAYSEGLCSLLELISISYYPSSNRSTFSGLDNRFPPKKCQHIDELSASECQSMTGLSTNQLKILFLHLRLPEFFLCTRYRYRFSGEEALLHFMVYIRTGETKLRLSSNYFGGDPRRFTYSIRMVVDHIYDNFYHKISGNSMKF